MQPPLFILSPPRSFTTITCAMLGNHPEMFGLAETNLFVADTLDQLRNTYRFRPTAQHGLLRSIAELGFGEQSAANVEAVRSWLGDNSDMSTAEMFRVMGEWAENRILIEKSPLHVYSAGALERMHEHFPDARYLHLTRHPRCMLDSAAKLKERVLETRGDLAQRSNRGRNPMMSENNLDPDTAWLKPHLRILEFLENVPSAQQLRLRGEDLLSETRGSLRQICGWLGGRDDDEALEAMQHPEQSPFAKYGPPNARYGNDPNFMENPGLRPYSYKPLPLDEAPTKGAAGAFSEDLKYFAVYFGY